MSDRIECGRRIVAQKHEPRGTSSTLSAVNILRTVYSYQFTSSGVDGGVKIEVSDTCTASFTNTPEISPPRRLHGVCMRDALTGMGFRIISNVDNPCLGCDLKS